MTTSIDTMKQQARRLRTSMAARGVPLTLAQALETVAHTLGHRDWNTASALASQAEASNASQTWCVGQTVKGEYLGQSFRGTVVGIAQLPQDRERITLRFDAPLDVVEFDSFSSFRQRVTAVIGRDGVSPKKRSDGTPHLRLVA
ncbi:MAG: glyoxalase superfamily protein, partial [Pseudomonadota bacterium]